MNNRRREKKRNLCADLIAISWTENSGRIRSDMGTLQDISVEGACLRLEQSIPAGTGVSLYYPKGKYDGKVKYCRSEQSGYLLGIEFEPSYRWSRLDFQPSHLLDYRALHQGTRKRPPNA
jgi:PilZ domain-containing protein